MKILFVMIVIELLSCEVSDAQQRVDYGLPNSHWIMKIEKCCTNYYDFKRHGSYVFYSGERHEYYPGVYSLKNDTIFFSEFYSDEDDPYGLLDREARFVALLLNKDSFQLLYREDPIRTKKGEIEWLKTLLNNSIYKRTR